MIFDIESSRRSETSSHERISKRTYKIEETSKTHRIKKLAEIIRVMFEARRMQMELLLEYCKSCIGIDTSRKKDDR